jgi:hypothetical protein
VTGVKVWPMTEGGFAVRAADPSAAKAALAAWLTDEPDRLDLIGVWAEPDDAAVVRAATEYVAALPCREGWYRWTPCNPRSCYDGTQHRPGHLTRDGGPRRGTWRGILVDYP